MPLLVYVATTSKNLERAKRLMKEVEKAGHVVSLDWTGEVREEELMSRDELSRRSARVIDTIGASDCLLFLPYVEQRSFGAAVEIGAALMRGKPVGVVTSSAPHFDHFFLSHEKVSFHAGIKRALQYLEKQVRD